MTSRIDDASGPDADIRDMPHIVLLAGVGGLSPHSALPAISTVTSAISVVFVAAWTAPDSLREAWRGQGYRGEFLVAADLDEAVDRAVDLHRRSPVQGIVTYSELLLRPQAQIAEALGLSGNSVSSVQIAQSKARQREVFAAAGVPSPRHALISSANDLPSAAHQVGFPAIVKPALGAGSQGVRSVADLAELATAYDRLRAEQTPFLQQDTDVVLEEELDVAGDPGTPYADYCSVESLLLDGRIEHVAVTDRVRLEHGCIEEGMVLPSRLAPEVREHVKDCAERAIRAVGLSTGATHVEIALCAGKPQVIEVNARAGGPLVGMLAAAGGYDFAADIARVALGMPPVGPAELTGAAWFRYMPVPEGEWRVVRQRPAAEVTERFTDLVYLRPRFEPGSVISRAMTQHLATFLVRGDSLAAARQTALDVERAFGIELEPVE